MDGFEATKKVRQNEEQDKNKQRVPIIALTASALSTDRAHCLNAGMDDFISKPYNISELHDKLAKWLPSDFESYSTSKPLTTRPTALESTDIDEKENDTLPTPPPL